MGLVFQRGSLCEFEGVSDDAEVVAAHGAADRVAAYLGRPLTKRERGELVERLAWDHLAGWTCSNRVAHELAQRLEHGRVLYEEWPVTDFEAVR